ncbi:phosphoadenylyl-sulfate reductase [uncultured Sulfitobacter sp.]|uniref:phosphoadenylyl-sulfate reductase n=1 Tax=uncultured Sulfitobacter sp. TaxID=191468 RepID=UPI002639BC58|nr:phosphoadenylyl-sulfate reductase [uncultured Sulfitobacter sp.]
MTKQPENITAARLDARFGEASAEAILAVALDRFDGRIALVSSFGAEAAILLHMVAEFDPGLPVILMDTELLFEETLTYQRDLATLLGLTDVRIIRPDPQVDRDRDLHRHDTTACCRLRKVEPLERALEEFGAVVSGRKRFQSTSRQTLRAFETDPAGRVKVNPMTAWSPNDLARYRETHALPPHPLVARGFPSIGCQPCTTPVADGEPARAGRWRDEPREECGIHITTDGKIMRKTG